MILFIESIDKHFDQTIMVQNDPFSSSETALEETVKDAMTRLSDQINRVSGETSSDVVEKEAVLPPLIQHTAAEIAAKGASILTQGGSSNAAPAARLLHAYSQMQLKIGDARLEYQERVRMRFMDPFSNYKVAYEAVQVSPSMMDFFRERRRLQKRQDWRWICSRGSIKIPLRCRSRKHKCKHWRRPLLMHVMKRLMR